VIQGEYGGGAEVEMVAFAFWPDLAVILAETMVWRTPHSDMHEHRHEHRQPYSLFLFFKTSSRKLGKEYSARYSLSPQYATKSYPPTLLSFPFQKKPCLSHPKPINIFHQALIPRMSHEPEEA
jgi:hypothetical protein